MCEHKGAGISHSVRQFLETAIVQARLQRTDVPMIESLGKADKLAFMADATASFGTPRTMLEDIGSRISVALGESFATNRLVVGFKETRLDG